MSALTLVTKETYEAEVVNESKLVIVDFFSPFCMPCKQMEPVLEEIADELAANVKIVKVDASAEPDLAAQFGIRGAPTFVALRGGEKLDMLIGAKPKEAMMEWIDSADL
ncbi:thioredoxin [Cerasicoccus fimbriatus]|uniref:thioredoxin n=1 Tax=Cerasicoccus fimbriatus TaxID=3014554 RepID=UPI0022B5C0A8|nr:thioredoxin [Cerasicoccus sp. TK19100]